MTFQFRIIDIPTFKFWLLIVILEAVTYVVEGGGGVGWGGWWVGVGGGGWECLVGGGGGGLVGVGVGWDGGGGGGGGGLGEESCSSRFINILSDVS